MILLRKTIDLRITLFPHKHISLCYETEANEKRKDHSRTKFLSKSISIIKDIYLQNKILNS
jgi:hypothetical protein